VPVLGSLFRYDTRERQKTNLMVFLKPTIIRGAVGGAATTTERYDYLRDAQHDIAPEELWFWKDHSAPQLPPQGTMPGEVAAPTGPATPATSATPAPSPH
jgi:general secretion pathway protein D